MDKVKTIISKEWAEVFKNRLVLFTVVFVPLVFVAMPLITLGATSGITSEDLNEINYLSENSTICEGLTENECAQIYLLDIFSLLFMFLPVTIPVTIAAYSIVGEKVARSLEPLLATPITTTELLIGKMLAAVIPAVAATWFGYLVYALGVRGLVGGAVYLRLLDPMWLLAVLVVGPLLTILAVCAAIIVSSRVSDPRVAEQLSAVVVLPLILFILGQSVGLFILNRLVVIIAVGVVALVDIVIIRVAIKTFQRETILTRWK